MAVPVEVIAQCWATVEPYVDVPSLVSVSKSCHPLRSLAIDSDTGKLKSSMVKIEPILERDEEGRLISSSPATKIPNYVPNLMNALHFPSLVRLDVGFPPNVTRRWSDDGERSEMHAEDSAFPTAFPMFAAGAEKLNNLEELSITVNSLITHEEGGALQSLYQILGENLARCIRRSRKLKRLKIFNEVPYHDFDEDEEDDGMSSTSKFSSAFMTAMIPVIRAALLSLEEVTILCGDEPVCSDFPKAGFDFFRAVLSLQKLRILRVQIQSLSTHDDSPLLKDLMDASDSIYRDYGRFPSEYVEHVVLPVRFRWGGKSSCSVAPLLSLCRNAKTLREVRMMLPWTCFNAESITTLCHILNESPLLETLSIDFHGYKDHSGDLLGCLLNFVQERAPIPGLCVEFGWLGCPAEQRQSVLALGRYAETSEHEDEIMCSFLHDGASSLPQHL